MRKPLQILLCTMLAIAIACGTSSGGGLSPQGGMVTGVTATTGGGLAVTGTASRPALGLLTSCGTGNVLAWNSTAWVCTVGVTNAVTGSTGTIAKFTGTNAIGNSGLTESGSVLNYAGAFTMTGVSNLNTLTASNTATGQTVFVSTYRALPSGTFNTTAGVLTSSGFEAAVTSSRSAGANALNNIGFNATVSGAQVNEGASFNVSGAATTNYGVYSTASGGSTNYSGYFDQGTFQVVGAGQFASTLNVTGLATLTGGVTTPANLTTTGTGQLVVAGAATITGKTTLTDLKFQQTGPVTLASGLTSDWDPFGGGAAKTVVLVTANAANSIIDGMVADANGSAPTDGAIRVLCNSGINHGQIIVRNSEGSASASANQFYINSEQNVTNSALVISHRQCVPFFYNIDRSKWQTLSQAGSVRMLSLDGAITDVALGAAVNDYAPTGIQYTTMLRLAPSGGTSVISGMLGGSDGDIKVLTAFATGITLKHNSGLSIAGNKFLLPGGTDITMPLYSSVILRYDAANTVWIWAGGTTGAASTGITNSAGNNVMMKSNGTNAIGSLLTDDSTTLNYNTGKFTVASATGNTTIAGTLGITGVTTITGGITGFPVTSCAGGSFVSAITTTGTTTCTAASAGGITNSAGNNVIPKSNGTNIIASSLSDNGTIVSTAESINTTGSGVIVSAGYVQSGGSFYGGGNAAPVYISSGVGGVGIVPGYNCGFSVAGTSSCYINAVGYQESTTQFRDLHIQDGKNADAVTVTGSTKAMSVVGAFDAAASHFVATTSSVATNSNFTQINSATGVEIALFTGSTLASQFDGAVSITGVLDVNNDISKFGAGADGYVYFSQDTIDFAYATNGTATGYINYQGYAGAGAQFRNLEIDNGEHVAIATFTGSTLGTSLAGALNVTGSSTLNGTTTLGDSTHDANVRRHLLGATGVPTAAGTACGTGPTIVGTDLGFTVTVGTGPTNCVVTFAGTTYANNPVCTVTAQGGTTKAYSHTTSTLTIIAPTAGSTFDVICVGY